MPSADSDLASLAAEDLGAIPGQGKQVKDLCSHVTQGLTNVLPLKSRGQSAEIWQPGR